MPVYDVAVLPWASFAVTVTPVATPAVCGLETVTWREVAGPGVNVTDVELAIAEELSVPVTPAVPVVVAEVSVAL